MDLYCSGLEVDPENHQVLGNPFSRTKQSEANGLLGSPHKIYPETLDDPGWQSMLPQDYTGSSLPGDL